MHKEKDYLKVAVSKSDEEILDAHWKKCASTKIWWSSTGHGEYFSELDDHHLITIVKMLLRFYKERQSTYLKILIDELLDEVESRL